MKTKYWIAGVVVLLLLAAFFDSPSEAKSHRMTVNEWIAQAGNVTNAGLIANGVIQAPNKQVLLAAVGAPDNTSTAGNDLYLYWSCADGSVQVVTSRVGYNAGFIAGNVNFYK